MIPVLENSQDYFRLYQIIVRLDQRDIHNDRKYFTLTLTLSPQGRGNIERIFPQGGMSRVS